MNNTLSPESVVELEKISKEWLNDATLADWNRFRTCDLDTLQPPPNCNCFEPKEENA